MLLYETMSVEGMVIYALLFASLYFEVFLLVSFFAEQDGVTAHPSNTRNNASTLPSTTIIVPCYNEEKTLAKTLNSLLVLTYPRDKLSIIVVNDGSTDDTLSIAQHYATKHPHISIIDKPNGGKASALNAALVRTRTELVGCLDADSTVAPDALLHIASKFSDPAVSAVTPAILITEPRGALQYMQRAEYLLGVFIRRVFALIDSVIVTPGSFSIFRTSVVRSVSNNPNNAWRHAHGTEDFEMGLRLQDKHHKILTEPGARVYTIAPPTLYALYRQRLRWVYGFIANTWDYKHMLLNPHYGNVGLLTLPATLLSIFGGVYVFVLFIFNILKSLYEMILRISITGIHWRLPSFDSFYLLPSNEYLILALPIIALLPLMLYYATRMASSRTYAQDIVWYMLLYGFITPLWLTSATVRALVGKESRWRVIR